MDDYPQSVPGRLQAGGAMHKTLEQVLANCDIARRRANDPVEFVHQFEDPHDQELVALVASSLAFGNVKALRRKISEALERLGPSPSKAAEDPQLLSQQLKGWKHRLYQGADLAALLSGARKVQIDVGSLGKALENAIHATGELAEAGQKVRHGLAIWVETIRKAGGLAKSTRPGARHLLPDPLGGSACKRLFLLLRWMVRGPDGVDLGLWRKHLEPSMLMMPIDVHIHRLAKNLGFTTRNTADYVASAEVTQALRRYDPDDPVRYDFALCHLGMIQDCPSQRDEMKCAVCPVKPVCLHWQG